MRLYEITLTICAELVLIIFQKNLPKSVAVDTLGKVDETIKLKKCIKAKGHGRKKKIEGATKIHECDILGPQKRPPHIKKTKIGLSKTNEEVIQKRVKYASK